MASQQPKIYESGGQRIRRENKRKTYGNNSPPVMPPSKANKDIPELESDRYVDPNKKKSVPAKQPMTVAIDENALISAMVKVYNYDAVKDIFRKEILGPLTSTVVEHEHKIKELSEENAKLREQLLNRIQYQPKHSQSI